MAAFTLTAPTTSRLDPGRVVVFREQMEGSQDNPISRKTQKYKAIWKVAWPDAEIAKVLLVGQNIPTHGAGGTDPTSAAPNYFSRQIPHAHPKAPWLFCSDIVRTEGREPLGKDVDGVASYRWAFLYCIYEKMNCTILNDAATIALDNTHTVPFEYNVSRYVRKRRKSNTQFMTSRLGSWQWTDNFRPVSIPISWRKPMVRIAYTWLDVPIANLNESYIDNAIGTTNLLPFAGYPAKSLLLDYAEWPDWNPIPGSDGFQVDVALDIIYYGVQGATQLGPNFFPDPLRNNSFHEVSVKIAAGVYNYPFPPIDWRPIFIPINV